MDFKFFRGLFFFDGYEEGEKKKKKKKKDKKKKYYDEGYDNYFVNFLIEF